MIREITSKQDWNIVLNQVDTFDFYHTFDYHKISSNPISEKPILIVYEKGNINIYNFSQRFNTPQIGNYVFLVYIWM